MKSLDIKYRNDRLTPSELTALRAQTAGMTDSEIEQLMRDVWMNEEPDTSQVDDARLVSLKALIDSRLQDDLIIANEVKQSNTRQLFTKILQAAAILIFIFLTATTFHFWRENEKIEKGDMTVFTRKGEKVSLSLPDGTQVTLNSESQLSYTPKNYNKKERQIRFNGEGYFDVAQDKDRPFFIDAKGLTVCVLGTSFNLIARNEEQTAELTLERGKVQLLSQLSGNICVLRPNQTAILNRSNGIFTIINNSDICKVTAWKQSLMVFRNKPLGEILVELQAVYGVTFSTNCQKCLTDAFTGVIPSTDLHEALDIIEKTYHLKAAIQDRNIFLKNMF
ncbi:MAG: FecR domain-containing protein [Tannerella sp.]|jgi:ferric-dicitrate binding protein FerR (iron transport regulator)|nr:FecR domain-containing protein [Tannerella sp.]